MGDNWVHKYNNLKKLHKLVTRYLEEKQGQSLAKLDPPNLNMIAKDGDFIEVLKLCELVIAVAVQCDRNQYYIQKIQSLPEISQHALMISLEQVQITEKKRNKSESNKNKGQRGIMNRNFKYENSFLEQQYTMRKNTVWHA